MAATVTALLSPAPGRRVLDATLGLGGHSQQLLRAGAIVVGVDRDPQARAAAQARLSEFPEQFTVRAATFAAAVESSREHGERFDGVLADLGVSSLQLDDPVRGFSIRSTERATMRMDGGNSDDVNADGDSPDDAITLIASLTENELVDILRRYGEEPRARPIARALQRAVGENRVSGAELAEAVRRAVPGRFGRHPAMRTFQALRIAVNDEIGQLERLIATLPDLLTPGGRAVVITFHSLEDRAVKHGLRAQYQAGRWASIVKKPLLPDDSELAANPRASSAKLRWAEAPA